MYLPSLQLCVCIVLHTCFFSLQITVQTSLDGEVQTSFPVTENLYFRPIPHPEDITVSFKNPRVNGTMLTVDLNIDWAHPQFEHNLTSYEIKFRTDNGSRAFDGLLDRDPSPLAPNSTQLTKKLESVVNPEALRLLVQVKFIYTVVVYKTGPALVVMPS